MAKKMIPDAIREIIIKDVENFNKKELTKYQIFKVEIRGKFIYLKLNNEPRCRLKYNGDLNSLEFAIYKYSSSNYDPDEFFFPGRNHVNGTIQGALKASLEAYSY